MTLASQHYHGWPLRAKLEEKMNTSTVINDTKPIDRLHIKLSKVRWATLLKTLMERYNELTSTDNEYVYEIAQQPIWKEREKLMTDIY